MNLKNAIILLLVLDAINGTIAEINYSNVPYWIEHLKRPDFFEFTYFLRRLLNILSSILVFIGVYKLINIKKIKMLTYFKLPMYFFLAKSIFWLITTLLSTQFSFFAMPPIPDLSAFNYIIFFVNKSLFLLILINYLFVNPIKELDNSHHVSNKSRLKNWIIDLVIIFTLLGPNVLVLMGGSIFDGNDFLNSSPYWFIALYMFWYYLIFEVLFLQTLGKSHNNSYVDYRGNKFIAILIRTLCRFIPLEAFSFLGSKGWHDSISKTAVVSGNSKHLE